LKAHKRDILASYHSLNFPFYELSIFPACHFINLKFQQAVILPMCYFVHTRIYFNEGFGNWLAWLTM